ncbi:hypothetical protein BC829DRAFT_28764 [Chytridium lagenaria]|nr:hypothetical protein BC829DRAFT_28764 [Chytridium lagenaria]
MSASPVLLAVSPAVPSSMPTATTPSTPTNHHLHLHHTHHPQQQQQHHHHPHHQRQVVINTASPAAQRYSHRLTPSPPSSPPLLLPTHLLPLSNSSTVLPFLFRPLLPNPHPSRLPNNNNNPSRSRFTSPLLLTIILTLLITPIQPLRSLHHNTTSTSTRLLTVKTTRNQTYPKGPS